MKSTTNVTLRACLRCSGTLPMVLGTTVDTAVPVRAEGSVRGTWNVTVLLQPGSAHPTVHLLG
jgi:hypothetical protein